MARGDDGLVVTPESAVRQPADAAPHTTGTVAASLDVRGWGWGDRSRTWTAATSSVLLAAVAGVWAHSWFGDGAALVAGIAAVVAAGAGAAVGALAGRDGQRAPGAVRSGQHAPAAALLLLGGTLGVTAAWQAAPGGGARLAAVGLTAAAVLALLGLCTAAGRAALTGAASVALAVGAWELGLALTTPARTGVALAFVSVLVLGYLPRLALMTAGLTRLDDQRSGGTPVSRHQVGAALGGAHRELSLATVATAVSAGAGGVLAVQTPGLWTVLAALLLSVVLCSRARAYPLAVEVVALLAAGLATAVRLILLWATDGGAPAFALAALGVLAVLPAVVPAIRVPEPLRTRLRRWLDLVESVSVAALIPVALGAFGLYGLLFGAS
ncbi:secretion protein snm4 [Streptomyces endophytica]|uniref:Secretion protein snm4 n=1 Tax=Streptomyces endophytica TaxID=2991496 RepID=A0ABY6PKD3_9ACTN|nr:secretion protein snm4 [Streptomyces endophytica]UZJ33978.1 secretion protein snm4 [Streptomyces endophytica]